MSRSWRLISNESRKPCWSFRGSFPEMSFSALTATCGGVAVFEWSWSTSKFHPTSFKHLAQIQVLTTKPGLHIPLGSRQQSLLTDSECCFYLNFTHILVLPFCTFGISPSVWFDIMNYFCLLYTLPLENCKCKFCSPEISIHIWRGIFIKASHSALSCRSPFTLFNHVYRRSLARSVMGRKQGMSNSKLDAILVEEKWQMIFLNLA